MSTTQNNTATILTIIRNDEAEQGAQYLPLEWIYTLRNDNVPEDLVEQVLYTRLGESARDARAFVGMSNHEYPDLFPLTVQRYEQGLAACAATAPEAFLRNAERVAEQFGRLLRPDIVERFHGEGYKARVEAGRAMMWDAFRKAAPHIHTVNDCWSMTHVQLLPVEELVAIAERIPMSPLGVTFVTKVLLRMSQRHHAASRLLGRIVNAIEGAPMEPEVNAPALYRFAIMAGVRLNPVGVPDWAPDNRTGQVPKAWFNSALRDAVVRNGWRFAIPTYNGYDSRRRRYTWEVALGEGDARYYYVHSSTEGWRNEQMDLGPQNEVMLPAVPHPSMQREGEGKYASIIIGFHPIAVPTMELIRVVQSCHTQRVSANPPSPHI